MDAVTSFVGCGGLITLRLVQRLHMRRETDRLSPVETTYPKRWTSTVYAPR